MKRQSIILVAVFRYICVMLKKFFSALLFCLSCVYGYSQVDSTFVDSKYLEDQFYFGINYIRLIDVPSDEFIQNGVSRGFYFGYIRDIPLNKRRNVGIGIGIGYGYNLYIQNLKISNDSNINIYEIIPTDEFEDNRFSTKTMELPIEFRWRNSTATKYSFWRVYAGLKLGYVFRSRSVYDDANGKIEVKNIEELDALQYGLTLSVGYSSINLNFYYGLNPLFKGATTVDDISIDMTRLNIGLIFYIL